MKASRGDAYKKGDCHFIVTGDWGWVLNAFMKKYQLAPRKET